MKVQSAISDLMSIKVSSLVRFCFESDYSNDSKLRKLDGELGGVIEKAYDNGEFEGKLNQIMVVHSMSRLSADHIVLVGVGEKKKLNHDCFRQAAGTLSRLPAIKNSESIAFYLDTGDVEKISAAVIEGYMLGRFKMLDHKSDKEKTKEKTKSISLVGSNPNQAVRIDRGISYGLTVSDSVILTRRLALEPGNYLPPRKFASQAQTLAKKYKFKYKVLNEGQIKSEKMGALLGVAQGSAESPRFVILEYNGGKANLKPVVLVGKGITFDSGGLSLKPPANMPEMKGDMQGAAIVLSAIVAAARQMLPLNIIGLIPLAENMPSSKALKPGDVIISRKGKSIEIISTDAEGRLILADALDYANKFKPQAVIDIATLTGAALYVLGYSGAPILGNNKKLMDAIRDASKATAEKVWEMPIWDEYRDLMKSTIADLKNSGGKPANTCTAAAFLENFIGDWPWAHIDIAYTDLEITGQPYTPKGASGFGLRLLIHLLSNWKKL
jgi:leucyl aminopeptidase